MPLLPLCGSKHQHVQPSSKGGLSPNSIEGALRLCHPESRRGIADGISIIFRPKLKHAKAAHGGRSPCRTRGQPLWEGLTYVNERRHQFAAMRFSRTQRRNKILRVSGSLDFYAPSQYFSGI